MYLRTVFHIILFWLFTCTANVSAQISATATVVRENGAEPDEETSLTAGDSYSGAAPLEIKFSADTGDTDSSSLRFEWDFSESSSFESTFLTRFDEETTYTFYNSGTFYVRLQATNIDTGDTDVTESFVIQIAESQLKVPNAFSPNDDGVNDVFMVSYNSLVSFDATVFNRWGQKLYHWGMDEIDKGWDGTAHGKQVPAGVYFIVVKAKGADGVVYNHKGDINILR